MWNLLLNFYLSHWEKYNTGRYAFGSYTVANVFEWAIYGTGVATNLPVALYNVHKSYSLRSGKMRSPREALRPLWALLHMFIVLSCRLIVSQMSGLRCDGANWLSAALSAAALSALAAPRCEPLALY
ncbi:putative sn-12-diacylglycerol ethanolamine-and cholinephosphotransferase, partial [Operophtera brumata]